VTLSGWSMNILRMNPTCLSVSTGGQATILISFSTITIIKVGKNKLRSMLDFELSLSFYDVKIHYLKSGMAKYNKRYLFFRRVASALQSESWTQ
jgi:hypothetical protein